MAAVVVGGLVFLVPLIIAFTGNVTERVPRRGPLGMLAASKIPGVVALIAIVALALNGRHPMAFWGAVVGLWTLFAPGEAMGALSYILAIRRLHRLSPVERDTLYRRDYSVINVSFCVALGIITLWRWAVGPQDVAWANIGVVGMATHSMNIVNRRSSARR